MSYTYPVDHQTLLLAFIQQRVKVLHEVSSDLRRDCRELERWAHKYAQENSYRHSAEGLDAFTDPESYGIYYEDDERDAEIAAELDAEERAC